MKEMKEKLVTITTWMETIVAILLIIAITIAGVLVIINVLCDLKDGLFQLEILLKRVLTLVVGIEFAKMLILHTPESVLEVLLYAVARQIVIYHDSALENLIGVMAVGVIFIIRRYFIVKKQPEE